jgi:hypothetical protein
MYLAKGKKCDLDTLTEIYGDSEIAQTILDSATQHKTISRIESGHLTLPEPHDAAEFHHRLHFAQSGVDSETAELLIRNPKLHAMFADFENRLAQLENKGHN